jgi:crossover junction endodeoxyribonuclease RuvC
MTSTGVCVIDGGIASLARVRSKPARADGKPSLLQRHDRITTLETLIWKATGLSDPEACPDLIVVEGPSYGSVGGTAHDRSGLWHRVVARPLSLGIDVVEVPPSNVKKYATGNGAADKDKVLAAVIRRYPHVDVDGNDVADALVLAAIGSRHSGAPIEASLPATHLTAMAKIRWPERTLV